MPLSGHFGPVTDLSWDPQGNFLVSVSSDQTCRLHGPWVRDKANRVCCHGDWESLVSNNLLSVDSAP